MARRKPFYRKSRILRRATDTAFYVLARGAFAFARALPLAWGLRLGAAVGATAFALLRPVRRKVLAHLRVAFPEKPEAWRMKVGRRSFMNLGRSFFEVFHFDEILAGMDGKGRWAGYVHWEHENRLTAERATGSGGVVVTGHCGNWELMAAAVVRRGHLMRPVVRELFDPRIDRLLNAHRKRYGYDPIQREGPAVAHDLLRTFRGNELLGLLMDQDAKVKGVFVPFFGHPAHTPVGPALLAYQVDKDALPCFIHRRPEGGHTLTIGAPVPRPKTGNREADIASYTAILTQCIEDYVRAHPDEWVWMHRRWKRRPEGEPLQARPVQDY